MTEADFMQHAISLAKKGEGYCHPNPMVGAVIVKDGRIIGEGYHQKYGELHAERNAFASLKESAEGASMYVTLEPCCHYGKTPPCTEAIIEHKIARVIIGSSDPNPKVAGGGVAKLREAGIEVVEHFMQKECDALNPVFFHYITTKTPYVLMKYAMTADGKIATRTGASKWITGERARNKVHEFRHACMGIMIGIGTAIADDPMLDCRLPGGKDPIRIICDSTLTLPPDGKIAKTAKRIPTILASALKEFPHGELTNAEAMGNPTILSYLNLGIRIVNFPAFDGVNLRKLMEFLGNDGIDSILLEGGGILNDSMLRAGLVQELDLFLAPKIFGGTAKSPVEGAGIALPEEAVMLELQEIEQLDGDLLLRYLPKAPAGLQA